MIVNRYKSHFEPELKTSSTGVYILWKINSALRGHIPDEVYEKNEKWLRKKYDYKRIKHETEEYLTQHYDNGKLPLFSSVEIEVINRCNGTCPFCPANRNADPRKLKKMDEKLFRKIIDELGGMNYSGRLALHSNNEPFLDSRIIEFTEYARKHVPGAFLYMFTNGTLVTLDKFRAIIPYLDRMVIDNYDDELNLHPNVQAIHEYCLKDPKLNRKVEIHVRKIHEVLNTRGGQSPNNHKKQTLAMSCILPYKQMIIRPDGRISLCCNDPYGKNTLADLNRMTMREAWYSERYEKVRRALRKKRAGVRLCRYCDTLPGPGGY